MSYRSSTSIDSEKEDMAKSPMKIQHSASNKGLLISGIPQKQREDLQGIVKSLEEAMKL